MTEQEYGDLMLIRTRREGHRAALPPSPRVVEQRPESERVFALRRAGMTQKAIANTVGLTRSRVSQILAGE